VEEITFEHISLNLPIIAKNALENLKDGEQEEEISLGTTKFEEKVVIKENIVDEEIVETPENELEEKNQNEDILEESDDNEEPYIYDEDELNELDGKALLDICDELGIEFEGENIERADVIQAILDAQNNDNE
jgi:hypothetical protein